MIAYPDDDARLPPCLCDADGRMNGHAFMLRGEAGLRADPRFVWWDGDDDPERQGWARGKVVCVGGVHPRQPKSDPSMDADPEAATMLEEDAARFRAKWE